MSLRFTAICFLAACFFASCMGQRSVTHWIVSNDTQADLSINITIQKPGGGQQTVRRHTVKPGVQEIKSHTTAKGRHDIIAGTSDGNVSNKQVAYFDQENWVMISFNSGDSASLVRKFGYLDTATFKKFNGRYAGFMINVESRMPAMLYTFNKKAGNSL